MIKVAVTGSNGLLGWHSSARLHAQNCAANYRGEAQPYELVQINHQNFTDTSKLAKALQGIDIVLHFAGVNRGEENEVEQANPNIARQLIAGCKAAGITPHIIYANSIHATHDTFYGRSKRIAGEILEQNTARYTNLILPHIFGECARPHYNNVTATLIDKIWKGEKPDINREGRVQLLHAGDAAQAAINAALTDITGDLALQGQDISVVDLFEKLSGFHTLYTNNIFPDISDPFDLSLFNSYRTAGFPEHYPLKLKLNKDQRGMLFETAKGGNQSQSFLSTTLPGQLRGDHFHIDLVERFLVVRGKAVIRIRRVLDNKVHSFEVSGDTPVAIDMPPLHTHNIENIGDEDVITFFWSHHLFDPSNPDTYADPVGRIDSVSL